jgi:hypothetical protein
MITRLLAICICLSSLVLPAGCSGVKPEPARPRPEVIKPIEPPAEPNETEAPEPTRPEPGVAEPNRIEVQTAPAPKDDSIAAEPNEVEVTDAEPPAAEDKEAVIEPNDVEAAEPNEIDTKEVETSGTLPRDDAIEPDEAPAADANEPAVTEVEPNEPTATRVEPNEPEIDEGRATVLPTFVERYAEMVQDYVREDGRVDYSSLRRRRLRLKRLLMTLDETDPNAYEARMPHAKLAFWINAYNLKVLEIITRNYPIESSWWLRLTWPPSDIRHIGGIWTDYKFIVMDEEFTLAEVERRWFRKTFGDPRVYLAITYASRSGPPLRRKPYRGDDLDHQLDEQVKRFLSDPKGFKIDRQRMIVSLSALFKPSWRGKEFVGRYGTDKKFKARAPETRAVLNFITQHLSREDTYFLEVENYTIEYMNFDWRLNDTSRGY